MAGYQWLIPFLFLMFNIEVSNRSTITHIPNFLQLCLKTSSSIPPLKFFSCAPCYLCIVSVDSGIVGKQSHRRELILRSVRFSVVPKSETLIQKFYRWNLHAPIIWIFILFSPFPRWQFIARRRVRYCGTESYPKRYSPSQSLYRLQLSIWR